MYKYLVAGKRDLLWGLTVSTVGYEDIKPGEDYPTLGHAEGYYFNVSKGRILDEFQMLYQPEGQGRFQSEHLKRTTIKAGDVFLLFPGEWHTYRPDIDTGWKSYWIGFKGPNIEDRMKNGFLSPNKPIYHIGYCDAIINLYNEALQVAQVDAVYVQQTLAGIANHLIGLMYAQEKNLTLSNKQGSVRMEMINKARLRIRESLETNLQIQQIAEELGISYSSFRKQFKEYTGVAPSTYQQDLRLQLAKELLATTDESIKNIAYRLCFESPDYFSSKFKIKTGMKPSEFREMSR